MLSALIFAMLCIIPSSAIINCRIACVRCTKSNDHPEILEVYCAMCDECKERRREWLRNADRNLQAENEKHLSNKEQYLDEDCIPQVSEEPCDPSPKPLHQVITTSTEKTTTSTTTTRRPCTPKPHCKPKPACVSMPCIPAFPMSLCNMCPMESSNTKLLSQSVLPSQVSKTDDVKSTPESLYFYVGVPKNMLKDLDLLRSKS
ncbi:unnamed protein product, partial [Brenthis ino]